MVETRDIYEFPCQLDGFEVETADTTGLSRTEQRLPCQLDGFNFETRVLGGGACPAPPSQCQLDGFDVETKAGAVGPDMSSVSMPARRLQSRDLDPVPRPPEGLVHVPMPARWLTNRDDASDPDNGVRRNASSTATKSRRFDTDWRRLYRDGVQCQLGGLLVETPVSRGTASFASEVPMPARRLRVETDRLCPRDTALRSRSHASSTAYKSRLRSRSASISQCQLGGFMVETSRCRRHRVFNASSAASWPRRRS